jgi:chaperonin GroES
VQPLGRYYYVRVPRAEERLPSGLILPDTARENWTDGVVLAVGPGKLYPPGFSIMWAGVGDRVLFDQASLDVLEHRSDGALGFVSDEQLVAIIRGPAYQRFEPANDYVLVWVDPSETQSHSILIPQEARLRPRSGPIAECGPGRMRRGGLFAGIRKTVPETLGYDDECRDNSLIGQRVFWGDHARTVDAWSTADNAGSVFVCAEDLLAVEEP